MFRLSFTGEDTDRPAHEYTTVVGGTYVPLRDDYDTLDEIKVVLEQFDMANCWPDGMGALVTDQEVGRQFVYVGGEEVWDIIGLDTDTGEEWPE